MHPHLVLYLNSHIQHTQTQTHTLSYNPTHHTHIHLNTHTFTTNRTHKHTHSHTLYLSLSLHTLTHARQVRAEQQNQTFFSKLKARKLKSIEKRTFGYENFFTASSFLRGENPLVFEGKKFFERIKA